VSEPVLQAEGLHKSFGALKVSDNVCFRLDAGECLALIGPNGAGKTTLIHQLSGFLATDAGNILFDGRDITRLSVHARANAGLARSFQITSIIPSFSVLENVALAVQARAGSSFRFFGRASSEHGLNEQAMQALEAVGLDERADSPAGDLSHGEKRILELAIALAMKPKALLLDEPMAGMGREESLHLVGILRDLKATCPMLLVEHDMDAVFALADRVAVMVYGRIIAEGTPDEVRANAEVKAAYLGEDAA
jgi:branched-chain amino acid transport system ATP-binding protein